MKKNTVDQFYRRWSLLLILTLSALNGCASYQEFQYIPEEYEMPSSVFRFGYAMSWQAVLQVMKDYDLEMQNQEAGVVKTRWIDNTQELNFADSFGGADAVKAAKFKLIINVVKGFRSGKEVSKVTVFKRQMVEQDFLQGWKVVPSDGILEKAVLYRIERTLAIENRLKKLEEEKQKEIQSSF